MRAGAAAASAGAAVAVGPPRAELAANMANETTRSDVDRAPICQPNHEATASDAMKVPSSTKRKKGAGGQSDDGKVEAGKESAASSSGFAMGEDSDGDIVVAPTTPANLSGGVRTRSRARRA